MAWGVPLADGVPAGSSKTVKGAAAASTPSNAAYSNVFSKCGSLTLAICPARQYNTFMRCDGPVLWVCGQFPAVYQSRSEETCMKQKRPYGVLLLLVGVALAAVHAADLCLWTDASTGFRPQRLGVGALRCVAGRPAAALPACPAGGAPSRRPSAIPTCRWASAWWLFRRAAGGQRPGDLPDRLVCDPGPLPVHRLSAARRLG